MDLATIPNYNTKKDNETVVVSAEDEEAELRKYLGQ